MEKNKSSVKRYSLPFILFTTKQKFDFVANIVSEVDIALMSNGRSMSKKSKFRLQNNLLKCVGLIKDE